MINQSLQLEILFEALNGYNSAFQ